MTELPNHVDFDVSSCIVNWNGRALLAGLLQSLRDHAEGLRPQIIVVDNASGDGSAEMVATEFPETILIRNLENAGFARANNQAAAAATSQWLLFLNNDTIILPGSLTRLMEFARAHGEYSAIGPQLIGADGQPQRTGRGLPTLRALLHPTLVFCHWTGVFSRSYRRYRDGNFDPRRSGIVPQLAAAALLVRRDAFDAVGGWDEGFRFGVEDVDLCVRLAPHGPIYYLSESRIAHLGRVSSHANRAWVYRAYQCGYARYLGKHHRSRLAPWVYKLMITADTPIRMATLSARLLVNTLSRRKEKTARTRKRLGAVSGFALRGLPEFWRS